MKKVKYIMMVLGILAIGFGIGILRVALLGTDPFSMMVGGFAGVSGISFGTTQLILNLFLFILQIFISKKTIGPGSFVNMIAVGYLSDFVLHISNGIAYLDIIIVRLLLLALAILIISFGVSLYVTSNLGLAPYDSIAIIMEERWKLKYKWCRMITDLFCIIVGLAFHSVIGIATIFMACGTGPFVEFFNIHISRPILNGLFSIRKYQHYFALKEGN